MVHAIAKPGDYVVCLGAGNITQWAASLPTELTELQSGSTRRAAAGGAA
jgi:UDP-N-acetylmuramate--alanine ligase